MVVKKFAKLSSCAVLCFLLGIMPASGADITSWENLRDEAENASEGSILNITEDITADGSSIGLLQKVLTLNFNGHTVNGGSYGDEPPLLFAANGSSETKVAVRNAVFKNFTVGEEGVIYSSNPHLEVIDVSLLNNKGSGEGVAIKNSAYNKLLITAQNSNVEISNNNSTGQEGGTGYGIFSSSSITLNAYEGKNLTINDDIKIDNSFDSDIYINNTFKSGCDLNGKVTLGGKLDLASSSAFISIGAKTGYKNGTLALTPNAARLNTLRLSVGGEATLDLQNYNIDSIVMGALKGETDAPLHLKLEYNAATGKMDCLDFSSVSIAGTPYLIVDEINILEDGDIANTAYLKNADGYLIEVTQDVISTKHGDKTYIFTPDAAAKGSYIVSKARNVSDLPFYIQDTMSNDKSIAITSDMTLTEDLGTFAGADRDTTIFGNGYTINANGHGGVTVGDTTGQKFGFNKVTLKDFNTSTVIDNKGDGVVSLTSVTLDNSNITNNNVLELYGNNDFKKGFINGTTGKFNVKSGKTVIGNDFTVNSKNITFDKNTVINNKGTITSTDKFSVQDGVVINNDGIISADLFNLGTTGTGVPSAVLNNSGTITVTNDFNLNKGDLYNKVGGKIILSYMQDLISCSSNVVNDGTIEMVNPSQNYYVGNSTTFLNGETGLLKGNVTNSGVLNNKGIIEGNIKNGISYGPTEYYGGTLTSNLDNITGKIDTFTDSSVFNVTGGTIASADKIYGNGKVNIVGDVTLNELLNQCGPTTVESSGKLIINYGSTNIDKIFAENGTLTFANNSTLDIQDKKVDLRSNDKVSIVAPNLNLNVKEGGSIDFNDTKFNCQGVSINKLTLDTNGASWQVNDAQKSNFALSDNLELIKGSGAMNTNYVSYDKSTGQINAKSAMTLEGVLEKIQAAQGNSHFYEMTQDESVFSSYEILDKSKLVVDGKNNVVTRLNTKISGDAGTKLVLNNTNLTKTKLKVEQSAELVISNTSGQEILIKEGSEIRSVGGKTTFTGNSDINFTGMFIGSRGTTGVVNMENATLTRNNYDLGINWSLKNGTLKYTNDTYLAHNGNSINFLGGTLDLRNGAANYIPLDSLSIENTSKIYLDADLAKGKMDNFLLITNPVSVSGVEKLQVAGINLLSDGAYDTTVISFVQDSSIMDAIEFTGEQGICYSPIYKYFVDYDETQGNFEFAKINSSGSGGGGNPSDAFNPSVLVAPVSQLLAAYTAETQVFDTVFGNMDMLMSMTKEERQAMKYGNKSAASDGTMTFSPNQMPEEYKGVWFKPYSAFESVQIDNGPSVSNVMYGTIVGGDTGIIEHKRGWDGMYSAYIGYNGSHQNYNDVGIYQNGGLLGLSGVWYKNNFFTGLTANVGGAAGNAKNMYGNEEFGMLYTGIASKSGYNWELANGKFVIQPSYMMSYTFVDTFNYTNAAGVKINTNPLNTIQIAPGVKFIGNLKNGWQPYIGVQMVWNVMNRTKIKANDVSLPEMSIDPYVQYGVGVQKKIGDKFTGYGEAMLRGGGRNGVSLNFGFRWALGKDK